jgi:MFS family permease
MYYVSSIVIALGTGLQGLLVMSVAVNNWFRRKRTIAQSLMSLGYSFAGVAAVPALVFMQSRWDWRPSAFATGLLIWVVGFPAASLLRTEPKSVGALPDGDMPKSEFLATGSISTTVIREENDFTLREAIRTHSFWILAIAWAIGNLGLFGVQVHLFLHLEQGVELSKTTTAMVWMVASLSNIPARLIGGFFGDRFPKNIMLGLSMAVMAVAVYILAVATSAKMAFVYAVLFGIGWGMRTPIVNAIQGEYFGGKSQGIIRGWLQSFSVPISIAAPVVAGYMADVQGTYLNAFIGMAAVSLVGAALVLLATPPKRRR